MIYWLATWGFFFALLGLGLVLPDLLHRRRGGARVCRLMHDGVTPGTRWCDCTTCGQCVMCPKEDRP